MRGRSGQGPGRTQEMNETTKKEWAELQTALAKKDPKGFEEVKKLAETNLPAAFNKMQLLAARAGLKTPRPQFSRGGGMGRREGGREGFGGRGEGFGGRGEGFGGRGGGMRGQGFGGGRGGMMNPGQRRADAEAKIAEKFPKEYAEYKKSTENNRVRIKELAEKTGIKLPANAEETAYVTRKYEKELEGLQWQERFSRMRELMEKEGYEMGFGGFGGGFGRRDGGGASARPEPPAKRDFSRNDMARKIKQQYPEEWEEYVKLNRTDKNAAKAKLEELMKKVK
ncbi:MAG: hypothetical protein J6331_08515 [Lentisphaeria bacterium]|nr:hypothetical protein [Lentisphaeria bacterium]